MSSVPARSEMPQDDRFHQKADASDRNAVFATGLDQPEGPVALPSGEVMLVEMGEKRACVTRLSSDRQRHLFARTGGRPTGLAFDGDGCIWVAGGERNSLVRLASDGRVLLVIEGDHLGPFLFPNDLAFGSDGMLYMTDSGMIPEELICGQIIRPDFATADYDGRLFRIDPRKGRVVARLAEGLRFANGVAVGPDGAIYCNETLTGRIYRHEAERGVEIFATVERLGSADRFCGPDGMAFDRAGRLYCAVYGERRVAVIGPDGLEAPSLSTNGDRPTNVAFVTGCPELLVTEVEHGAVERIAVPDLGLDPLRPELGL